MTIWNVRRYDMFSLNSHWAVKFDLKMVHRGVIWPTLKPQCIKIPVYQKEVPFCVHALESKGTLHWLHFFQDKTTKPTRYVDEYFVDASNKSSSLDICVLLSELLCLSPIRKHHSDPWIIMWLLHFIRYRLSLVFNVYDVYSLLVWLKTEHFCLGSASSAHTVFGCTKAGVVRMTALAPFM